MRFLPVNRQALMVELADLDETLALLGSLQREPIDGVQELVPAARTVLVQFAPARLGVAELVRRIAARDLGQRAERRDRKSTRLNSSHLVISYAVFCLKKKR